MLMKQTAKMKNKTVIYLEKGNKENSALLKRRAVKDYFGEALLGVRGKGKPIIEYPKGFGISVAHSGDLLAVVITKSDVGIDIEERVNRDVSRLFSFFHESERNSDFFDLWVKKEAFGKMTGDGIFLQKGKKLETDSLFLDISKEVSSFSGKAFSAVICFPKDTDIIETEFIYW